jgi:hypothetical protein
MASPTSLYGGSSRRVVRTTSGDGAAAGSVAPPVKQLLRRLKYRLRRSAAPPAPVSFGYDMQSYSQNFDDGLGSSSTQIRRS